MLDGGRTWMKLSGAYFFGRPPDYAEAARGGAGLYRGSAGAHGVGQRLAASDRNEKPDDAVLFDLLGEWAPDEATRQRILVENPAKLYGFPG